jgi:hypothetical protein
MRNGTAASCLGSMLAQACGTLLCTPGALFTSQFAFVFGVKLVCADRVLDRRRGVQLVEQTNRLSRVPYPACRSASELHEPVIPQPAAPGNRTSTSAERHGLDKRGAAFSPSLLLDDRRGPP